MNRGFRGGDAAEPVAVLQAAIQQLAQRDQQAHEPAPAERAQPAVEVPQFIPADYFQGARQGYYFGTGDEGTGYVPDGHTAALPGPMSCALRLCPRPVSSWCPLLIITIILCGGTTYHWLLSIDADGFLRAACCVLTSSYYRDEQQELEPEAAAGRTQLDPEELLRQAEQQAEAAEVRDAACFCF